jgi:glycerol kinase
LVTSVAWSLNGKTTYALEGSVFNAGSAIQWLRDELGIISTARECDILAESVADNGGVYLVSAFTGLGAPHWDMYARGSISGITRGTTKAHLCRAALEGIAFQVNDLMDTMEADTGRPVSRLRVDGGASVSDFMMQFQADLTGIPVDRPDMVETTAQGAAWLAGLCAGVWQDTAVLEQNRRSQRVFMPTMTEEKTAKLRARWAQAIARSRDWDKDEIL